MFSSCWAEVCAISKALALKLGLGFGEQKPAVVTSINRVSEQWSIAENLSINDHCSFGYNVRHTVAWDDVSSNTLQNQWHTQTNNLAKIQQLHD